MLDRRHALGFLLPFSIVGPALAQSTVSSGTNTYNIVGLPVGGDLTGTLPNPTIGAIGGNVTGPYATAALGQMPGTISSAVAAAGNIGEYLSSTRATSAAVALVTTGTVTSVISIVLTAGDWDVWGSGVFQATSTAVGWGTMTLAVNNASNAVPVLPAAGMVQLSLGSSGATSLSTTVLNVPIAQFISSASVTAYLVAAALASAGVASCTVAGIIQARRRR